jgi:hypothetical protein
MLKRFLIVLTILTILVILFSYPRVCVVRDRANGTLFWNADQALLFVAIGSSGARLSYVRYALEPYFVSLGDVRPPDNQRYSQIVVIRITDEDVQKYVIDPRQYATDQRCFGNNYALFRGNIYTGCLAQGTLWKWSGTQFEPGTQEELCGFDPMKEAQRSFRFDDVDGWSMREYALSRVTYPLILKGQPMSIVSSGRGQPRSEGSVELIRPGKPPLEIWRLDERPHIVSKAEYEHMFGKQ